MHGIIKISSDEIFRVGYIIYIMYKMRIYNIFNNNINQKKL